MTDANEKLPMLTHVSQLKTRGTCNCGNKQMDRDDPFDHKVSNRLQCNQYMYSTACFA